MSEPDVRILAERAEDGPAIERLIARTFGPGRYTRSAFRIRERVTHVLELSFSAWIGTLLVGSIRLTPVRVGAAPALFVGPLTVEPPFRGRGVGRALLRRAIETARAQDHRLLVLVGDAPYYTGVGFVHVEKGRLTMPGPVDPGRILVLELVDGAFDGVSGQIRPQY